MKKLVIVCLIFVIVPGIVKAQADYNTGIGVRAAPSAGLTVKHFLSERAAIEGIFSTRWGGITITPLYEIHQTAFETTSFNFYYGIGGHLGIWDDPDDPPWFDETADAYIAVGADGIIGLEYTFEEIPFNISLDWKPALNIVPDVDLWLEEVGLSVRFIIR